MFYTRLLLSLALVVCHVGFAGDDDARESTRYYSRPTHWFRGAGPKGPNAVRYYLGFHQKMILVETVEHDGERLFHWGEWHGPRDVSKDDEMDLEEALLLTGQNQLQSEPPSSFFKLSRKAYQPRGPLIQPSLATFFPWGSLETK